MRVLLFNLATDIDDPVLGFTTDWITALAARVEFVDVITMRKGNVQVPGNVRVTSVGTERGYGNFRRLMNFYKNLAGVLRKSRPDVCFSHMIPLFTVLGAVLLKIRHVPIVIWHAHPRSSLVFRLSHYLSDVRVTSIPGAYPHRAKGVIFSGEGIDVTLFAPDGTRPEESPVVLCAGRLSPIKDHPTLLRAAALLEQHRKGSFRILLVGGPATASNTQYVESLRLQVMQLGLESVVTFAPPVFRECLPAWYRKCTVHVNCTPTGSGDKVVLEAMSCGRPCMVANEGFRETLGEYADALMFERGNHEQLAHRLEWVLSLERRECDAMGARLRERVVERHSLEHLADRLMCILSRTIENRGNSIIPAE